MHASTSEGHFSPRLGEVARTSLARVTELCGGRGCLFGGRIYSTSTSEGHDYSTDIGNLYWLVRGRRGREHGGWGARSDWSAKLQAEQSPGEALYSTRPHAFNDWTPPHIFDRPRTNDESRYAARASALVNSTVVCGGGPPLESRGLARREGSMSVGGWESRHASLASMGLWYVSFSATVGG